MKNIRSFTFVALIALLLTACGGGQDSNNKQTLLDKGQAVEQMNAYFSTGAVSYRTVAHNADTSWVGVDTVATELPPIDKYPLSVKGAGDINVELFSSTEKANASQDRWLDAMAKKFNASGSTINGKSVSISVRPIASGLALDYIKSRTHIPAAYSPSNVLWGAMIESTGLKTQLIEKRLAGNVAGILMKQGAYDAFVAKYGDVSVANVIKAAEAKDLKPGHTDPNQSSTGLNFLTQELLTLDPANPLSQAAVDGYRKFQGNIPSTSPTTDEMAKVANKGLLDSMIMEAQAYTADPKLATGWRFTPAGVRHDSPLYALGDISADQTAALQQFAALCTSGEGQQSATSFGFNQHNDYVGAPSPYTGTQLFAALDLWKQNKDAGRPVVSVFVVDRSGSMDGAKLARTKEALLNGAGYISPSNYVGLVSYSSDGDITVDLPIAQFTDQQRSLFVGAVKDLRASGGTATNSALFVGLKLMKEKEQSVPGAKLRLLLMTDGQQNEGLSLDQTVSVTAGLEVPVYGIGFEASLSSLNTLAEPNEGYVINADNEDLGSKLKGLFNREL